MNKEFYKTSKEDDAINHPSHYNRDNAMECLEEMRIIFGNDAVAAFCLCNVWKYRYRASSKGHDQDIAKSDFYMKKYVELIRHDGEETK